jgi:hypothetical protein
MNPLLDWGLFPIAVLWRAGRQPADLLRARRTLTRDNGAAVGDNQNSQTAGANGPVLLQDVQLIQKLQRFDRERIPSAWCMPAAPAPMAPSR